ncbi:YceI family protein [Streptomyces sp. NPDC059256]|uniref:YceI family protein n=1 Tax=Streptomyces sp. NPDC059256 TaxID=3346794 RepID=UPI0036C90054
MTYENQTVATQATELPVPPGVWQVDAAHSRVAFSVRHMTIATVYGRFGEVTGWVTVPADPTVESTVEATIGVASVSSGHPKRDELIRSPEFLDVQAFPHMTFSGSTISGSTPNRPYAVDGELTIKGTSRPVRLDIDFGGFVTHRGATRAGFHATTSINRRDFGLTFGALLDAGGAVVSDRVDITLDIELVLSDAR